MFYPSKSIGFIGILYRYQADRFMLLSIVQWVSPGNNRESRLRNGRGEDEEQTNK